MNLLIKKELDNVNCALMSSYEENCTHIFIQKGIKDAKYLSVEENKYYQIKVKDYIIHPYEGFILHSQWNNNIIPPDDTMNVHILQIMGKMVRVNGVGVNVPTNWAGWLPKESFEIIKLL